MPISNNRKNINYFNGNSINKIQRNIIWSFYDRWKICDVIFTVNIIQCIIAKTLLNSPTKFDKVITGFFNNELFLGFCI